MWNTMCLASFGSKLVNAIDKGNGWLNDIVWGWPMIVLILGVGLLLTILTKFLQIRKFGTSVDKTLGDTFRSMKKKGKHLSKKETSVSPFEAFSTAISGTVGTGNIVGVSSAIMTGGPGAVLWMWISAFFGMVTNYAENVLGMFFRKKEKDGEFSGGPAYYLSEGVGRNVKGGFGTFLRGFGKVLAVMAAVFCLFAAIGMSGVQTTKMAQTIQSAGNSLVAGGISEKAKFWIAMIVGIVVAIVLALVILGGIKSIGRTTSILIPFMSLLFILMAFVIIFMNADMIVTAFALIFRNAFGFKAAVGGFTGYMFAQVIQKGLARGVFSNEAGLGSSVIAHSASETREPVKQGLWGIFEVFFDTFVICTLTALVILVSFGSTAPNNPNGMYNILYSEMYADTEVSMMAFSNAFSHFGVIVYSIILPLFAFTTILAWSYYGEKSIDFLFRKTGEKGRKISRIVFKVLYVVLVVVAAWLVTQEGKGELMWAISDTANGLMALPNLIGLAIMCTLVAKITKNYFDRKKGKNVKPMLSAYDEQNETFIKELEFEEDSESNVAEEVAADNANKTDDAK
ncbi:MAG: alanine:cation symporter family protein [Clostridiales bacterium]|nr:alanine:cation symporter family protein [Clostridiales bacterium]